VVSPSTVRIDRMRKMPIYAREGVSDLWLLHPGLRTLEVYRLEGQRWMVASSHVRADSVRAEPFEALELDMSRWWLEEA
jgi:Uma2 family endonuclease